MGRTEDQKKIDTMLTTLERSAISEDEPMSPEMVLTMVQVFRAQQEQLENVQAIFSNFGMGLRAIVYIGGILATIFTITTGYLTLRGGLKP